eukprot:CAMPEP_0170868928 /NCGR_PEP_ID=MMETSP0734-20130129/23939_1 /TAXON_ID=186038 /ORGANISM="Fragilariopsis kerguelensis, Strain L26-C5" /LENGTH=49 /DNA_ID=CAMNT_0011246969 /DNA_START=202 /DNA_END=351 /DNA_ORIENTATION=+
MKTGKAYKEVYYYNQDFVNFEDTGETEEDSDDEYSVEEHVYYDAGNGIL